MSGTQAGGGGILAPGVAQIISVLQDLVRATWSFSGSGSTGVAPSAIVLQDKPTINQPTLVGPTVNQGNLNVTGNVSIAGTPGLSFIAPSGIVGATTTASAVPGQVGEVIAVATAAPGTSLPTGGIVPVASMTLTQGDWDVIGWGTSLPATATVQTFVQMGLSTSSAGFSGAPPAYFPFTAAAGLSVSSPVPGARFNIPASTVLYLMLGATFTGGTCTGYGGMIARRAR